MTRTAPAAPAKSEGHIAFAGAFEFFKRSDDIIYRAPIADPIMTDGCRVGRFECYPHHWERFSEIIIAGVSA